MHVLQFVNSLNSSSWSTYLRENDYAFGIIESFHILGLGFSVGIILWADLRLLGVAFQGEWVAEVLGSLEKSAVPGFGVMFASGLLLLSAEPLKCYTNIAFRLKAIMLVLAGANVAYFHSKKVFAPVVSSKIVPWKGKMIGAFSLAVWLGIIVTGRWTAYF
jgi:hypothetical protein